MAKPYDHTTDCIITALQYISPSMFFLPTSTASLLSVPFSAWLWTADFKRLNFKKATKTKLKNIYMLENHLFKFNCISAHVISVSTGSGTVVQKVRATVWMEHSCSRTDSSSSLQHRLRQIHTGKASGWGVFGGLSSPHLQCCVYIYVPYPIVWPQCGEGAAVSNQRASWRWCPQASLVWQVSL